jgi:hypothetical protein
MNRQRGERQDRQRNYDKRDKLEKTTGDREQAEL